MPAFGPVASSPVGSASTGAAVSPALQVSEESAYVVLTNISGIVITEESAYVVFVPAVSRRRQALVGSM